MLPSLGGLSLRAPPVVRTGEFVTLSREEADERNARGEIEPVSHEEYVPSRELPDGDDYFRVRFKYQKPDHTYDYTVYDAETLWRWVKDRYTLPHNRDPIWREDWMALHDAYDPEDDVPQRVARLPSLLESVLAWEGSGDEEHLVRSEFPDGDVLHYEGAKDEEHLVRIEHLDGGVDHYEGAMEDEYIVRSESPDGKVHHYEGPNGEERLVRTVYPDGRVKEYK